MPFRIIEVFALDKSGEKGKCRYNKLCSFKYSDQQLADAERVQITHGASYVDDEECVARVIEDPTHVNFENGLAYTPGAFGDASKWGLSVQRIGLTSTEEIERFGRQKAAEKGRAYRGFVSSKVGILRGERSPTRDQRLVGIFSTPLDGIPAHADIYASLSDPSPDEKEATKALFWKAFNLDSIVACYLAEIAAKED